MFPRSQRPGAVAILLLLTMSAVGLAIIVSLTTMATGGLTRGSMIASAEATYLAAEAGLNDAIYKLNFQTIPAPYQVTMNDIPVDITVVPDADPYQRIVTAVARGPQDIVRSVEVTVRTNTIAASVNYAVQSGTGGISMAQNSEIRGNLYANGPIDAENNSLIVGDVWSSGPAGSITGATIGTSAPVSASAKCPNPPADPKYNNHVVRSNSLRNTDIYGKAHYQNVSGAVRAGARNDNCQEGENGPNCFDGAADPAATGYPITPQHIQELKTLAENSLVTVGNVTISSDTTFSARKIDGNLTVTAGTLTIEGPIWVTGTIDINHPGVTVRLPASMGEASTALITDQAIEVKNNAQLQGSGNPKSFLLIIATKTDVANPVILGANNSTAVIYFAPNGLITVAQNAVLNNTTGQKIRLENNACVQYNSNLTGFYIPAGPPTPITPVAGTWKER